MKQLKNNTIRETLRSFFRFLHTRSEKQLLLAILVIAFILRIPLLLWGIPLNEVTGYYHPDEVPIIDSLCKFPSNIMTNQLVYYGGTMNLIWGTFSFPIKFLYFVIPTFHTITTLPNVLHITCRFFSIVTALLTIWLTHHLTRLHASRNTALLSALLVSASFYHCMSSAYITFDISLTCFVLISFILLWHTLKSNSWKAYILSGLCTGLLCSIKISGGVFFFCFFASVVTRNFFNQGRDQTECWYKDKTVSKLFAYCMGSLLFFCLSSPHVILQLDLFIDTIMRDRILWTFREKGGHLQLLKRISASMINVTNIWVILCALLGVIQNVRNKKRFSYLFILYMVGNILVWGAYVRDRFFLPLVPFVCYFASEYLVVLTRSKKKYIKIIAYIAISVLILFSVFHCLQGMSLRLHDSRTEASQFIHSHIPVKSSLGIAYISKKTPAPPHKTYYPSIRDELFTIADILTYPEYIVISAYDLTPIIDAFIFETVTDDYKIKDAHIKQWPYYQPPSPEVLRFYDLLLTGKSDYILIKRFSRRIEVPIEHHPPTIWILKRDKAESIRKPEKRFSYSSYKA